MNQSIVNKVKNVKKEYFKKDLISDQRWNHSLNILEHLADIDPISVREGLKFEFNKSSYSLKDYKEIYCKKLGEVEGSNIIRDLVFILKEFKRIDKNKIVLFSATFSGRGVEELFCTAGSVFSELGIEIEWHIMYPYNNKFYSVIKSIHDAMQGKDSVFTEEELTIWKKVNALNANILRSVFYDKKVARIYLEDLQVLHMIPTIKNINKLMPVAWRSHIANIGVSKYHAGALQIKEELFNNLSLLTEDDVVMFQPYNVISALPNKLPSFVQNPGIDPLRKKTKKLLGSKPKKK